ncbi:AAA family ATPase [Lutimonas sp.]|uniref:AAA family ATPase n=1 Tax=Lutimonas sp. TaxID=1872403 RepID=UPI003D9B2F07
MKQNKIVITGGPGTGKSTLIEALQKMAFTCMPEISRTITKQAQESGIDQLFLKDPLLFSKLLLEGRIDQYKEAEKHQVNKVFFDRGIPDIHAYMEYSGTQYPNDYIEKSMEHRYAKIFMMPPWKAIYKTDNERYESFDQSELIYEHLVKAYKDIDYDIVIVPEGSVKSRVAFLLKHTESL